jgi:TadE-like protein
MTQRGQMRRQAAAVIELAAVVIVFLFLLFGIMEYGRFVFVRQVVVNAAREGARYAVVNTTDTTLVNDTLAYVKQRMAGVDKQAKGYNCQIYMADQNGNNIGAAGNAQFGQYVAVQIDYDYSPILPSFLFMGKTIRISSKALMYSEAN